MGFFDSLFFSAGKKIGKKEFKKALRELPDLSKEERAYVEAAFNRELANGSLTASEVKKRIYQLRKNYYDSLDSSEVGHLGKKLEEEIGGK